VYFVDRFTRAMILLQMRRAKHLYPRAACVAVLCFFAALYQSVPAQTGGTKKLPSAEKIVDSYLKAIGGRKQASSIRDATYEWTIQLGERHMGTSRSQFKAPASQRSEVTYENGEQSISAANPSSVWTRGLNGELLTSTGKEAALVKLSAALKATHLVDYKKANVLARVLSLDNSAADPAYIVEFSSRGGARLRYHFSTKTKLLISIQDDASITWFEDYRPEGNILEPHRLRISQGGSGEFTFKLQRVSYNSGVSSTAFDPPRAAEAVDVTSLLREVSRNQDEVEKRFTEYSFLQKGTAREIDSKGVIKKETVKLFEVFPLPNRNPIMKLISENGVPLSGDRAAKEDKRVQEEFLKAERDKDKDAQKVADQRAERDRKKAAQQSEDDDVEISQFFRHCEFVSPRRERFQDRETIVFDFRAQPGFKPSTRQESLISKLVGVVWIDPQDKQVIRLEARLAEGFKMGGGLLLSLRPGAALIMEQMRMNEGIWMPRFMQINLSVKVLLFGGGDFNQTVEWSDYKHFSADVDSYKLGVPKTEEPLVKKP
jgi:hypothetical protein